MLIKLYPDLIIKLFIFIFIETFSAHSKLQFLFFLYRLRCFWTSSIKLQWSCGWTKTRTCEPFALHLLTPSLTPGSTSFSAKPSFSNSLRKSSACFARLEWGRNSAKETFTVQMLISFPLPSPVRTLTPWWPEICKTPQTLHRLFSIRLKKVNHAFKIPVRWTALVYSHLHRETHRLHIHLRRAALDLRLRQRSPLIFQICRV